MKTSSIFSKPKLTFTFLLFASFIFTSCGSFESVSYHDGVYGERPNENVQEDFTEQEEQINYQDDSGSYYQALFAQKAADYSAMSSEPETVFTDVDSYSTQSYDQSNPDYTSNYGGGFGSWGENPSQITVNFVDNSWGWNNFGWGGAFGFGPWQNWGWNRIGWGGLGWNNFGWGGGFGWNNWGWNRFGWGGGFGPWGPGWNNWGWGGGLGWGWNGWGPGWNNWGWNNGLAFANGNRGYRNNFNNGAFGRESTIGRNTTRRNVGRGTDGYSRGRATTRSTSRSNNSTISRRGSSRNSSATSRSSSSRSSSARTSRSTSRSSGSMRSSRSSSRSSGSMRSSGGGRSSSVGRSGGGRSGGRRG